MGRKVLSGAPLLAVVLLAAAVFAPQASASVPPPTKKLDCYTGNGGLFWGYVKILPDRRYWASDSVWAGEGKGSGRLKPLRRKRFRVVTGPLRTMRGRWFRRDGIRIHFTFGGSSSYNDKYCARDDEGFRVRSSTAAASAFRGWA